MKLYKNEDLCIECKNEFFSKPYDHRDPTPGQLGYCIKCDNCLIKEKKMEFLRERVFTSLNADELRAGDKVIGGNTLADLKYKVGIETIDTILDEGETYRFTTKEGEKWLMVLLVERKENCTNCKYSNPHKNLLYCEDDNIPIYVGGEKLSVCDKYKPKTEDKWCKNCGVEVCSRAGVDADVRCPAWQPKAEQKAEKKYRPFKDTDELIKVWDKKFYLDFKPSHDPLTMPLIWVRYKDKHIPQKGTLIRIFFEEAVSVDEKYLSLETLFKDYEFLDGSPCGVEE